MQRSARNATAASRAPAKAPRHRDDIKLPGRRVRRAHTTRVPRLAPWPQDRPVDLDLEEEETGPIWGEFSLLDPDFDALENDPADLLMHKAGVVPDDEENWGL